MLVVHRRWWGVAALVGLLGFAPSTAFAVGWSDDFNDGSITDNSPVTWVTNLIGLFPDAYDASSGDLLLNPTDDSPTSQSLAFVPETMGDTYIRTQGIVLPDPNNPSNVGGNLVVLGRIDPNSLSGYLMYFDVSGNLNLQLLLGGGTEDIGVTYDSPFNASEEVVIEMNIIGNQLNGYVWQANDPNGKPAEPQVTALATDHPPVLAPGFAGIAFAEDDFGTSAYYRYVIAQDTPIIDSNPSNGDFDGDDDVDGADFLIWQRGYGLTGQPDATTGDADDDGDVDDADLALWKSHYGGAPVVAAIGSVPEPASLALLAAGGLAMGAIRCRRRA